MINLTPNVKTFVWGAILVFCALVLAVVYHMLLNETKLYNFIRDTIWGLLIFMAGRFSCIRRK